MNVENLLAGFKSLGIEDFVGVPDSTLKSFCDYVNTNISNEHHFVPVNEGAAVGLAAGIYLGKNKVSCVYMQNSGIGNAINPIASLINEKVYDIPMLFMIGYRGEPGIKDEPQHKFQGEITIPLLDCLDIPSVIISSDTTQDQLDKIIEQARKQLDNNKQFAIIVKKDTFDKVPAFVYDNGYTLNREAAIKEILKATTSEDIIVSTTGKISREVYEQCDALFGNHERTFLTVGSMGHASMIALGIALEQKDKQVYCIDGDGAAIMHMGSMAFIGKQKITNFHHITLNNDAHESVGGMPTNCLGISLSDIAKVSGYTSAHCVDNIHDLNDALASLKSLEGPTYLEVKVALGARSDLGRPKESAIENKENFMKNIKTWRK
ncbi:MAG: phosphonopyruvate decarboxylase [Longicatena sp.]